MVIRSNERRIVKNPLKPAAGRYLIDFEDLEAKAAEPRIKILILCNPHNPAGRVWTKRELERVTEICERHDVFVIADKIIFAPFFDLACGCLYTTNRFGAINHG